MNKKFDEFLRTSRKLNEQNIIPVLMGSLGLEYLTKIDWNANDIDIHVKGDARGWSAPDKDRIYNRDAIIQLMEELGYQLIDTHEHEFSNGTYSVEYGTMNALPSFANVNLNKLQIVHINGVQFYLPNAKQFLKIYQSSYQDSYRAYNNNHKDLLKIRYLEHMR